MIRYQRLTLLGFAIVTVAPASGQLSLRVLASSSAPNLSQAYGYPLISGSVVAFSRELPTRQALVGTVGGPVSVIRQAGEPVPGMPPGWTFETALPFPTPDGDIVLWSRARSPTGTLTPMLERVALSGGAPTLIAREGLQAPGFPTGALFTDSSLGQYVRVGEGGVAVFSSAAQGGGVGNSAISRFGLWKNVNGQTSLIARSRSPAPDIETGTVFNGAVADFRIDRAGSIAFVSRTLLSNGNVSAGLFVHEPSGFIRLAARVGDQVIGGSNPAYIALNSVSPVQIRGFADGNVLVGIPLTGPNRERINNHGLFMSSASGLQPIAVYGDPAPGVPGATLSISEGGAATMAANGRYAFFAGLSGPGLTVDNNGALYVDSPTGPRLAVREGDQSPISGFVYSNFGGLGTDLGAPRINSAGQLLFLSYLSNPETQQQSSALFGGTPGNIVPIAVRGQHVQIAPGDTRVIDSILGFYGQDGLSGGTAGPVPGSGYDGLGGVLSEQGWASFVVRFTNQTTGVISAQVPAPSSISLLPLALWAGRRRRVTRRT